MPRSNLLKGHIDMLIERTGTQIRVTIVTAEALRNVPRSETIRHSGMSQASFYKAWKDPSLFRVGQLVSIYDFLKIPEEERRFA